ncbi:tetratricopeptide repeat protein 12 isoform X3 [Hyla sarda]|uniref:tetratricopeptide repeat protein 12 isoform X3 n=1 Tax=Hyla sarda TaxID=327740 RepID=UPI0024C3662A|nr:tetratricopeptide repeat protein 12 isoform X3 [Hyla sarda]
MFLVDILQTTSLNNMSEDPNLEKFLKDVDEVSDILQGLNSEDTYSQEQAILKADQKLEHLKKKEDQIELRDKTNRTLINKSGTSTLPSKSEISQESFIAILEKDASERADKRSQNKELANALKDLGNKAFDKGDYETAIQCYSEGLEKLKDMQVLYTNRAQAYIKLEKYEKAISDCEWALKCDDKCVKAYVHMGRAHLSLKNYEEARQCYKMITDIDITKEKLVKGYLRQVDYQEKKDIQEQKAWQDLEAGVEDAVSVTQLLTKLSKAGQSPLYYSGGIQLLVQAVNDSTAQTLFRTKNGFSIIADNCVINRCLLSNQTDTIVFDLCLSVLSLWKVVCNENENQHVLISHPNANSQIFSMLTSEIPDVQNKTFNLFDVYSTQEEGRSLLLNYFKPSRLFESLIKCGTLKDVRGCTAMDILFSLTQEERLRSYFRTNFKSELLPSLIIFLKTLYLALVNMKACLQAIAVMGHLTEDTFIRRKMAASLEYWDSCLLLVDKCNSPALGDGHKDALTAILGLLFNLSLEENSEIKERGVDISRRCLSLLSNKDGIILTRSVGILSRVLPQCPAAVEMAVQEGIVKKLMKFLKTGGKKTSQYSVKVLAVCTKEDTQARKEVYKYDKNFVTLVNLLRSEDEITIGNAALCLGNCFDLPGAASTWLQPDILKLLLTHAGGDSKRPSVQRNAAIALGKLCSAEPRYMAQLRELHGIEILNSCRKYVCKGPQQC